MSICKQISLTAKENTIVPLKALLIDMVAPSTQEQGCLRYELFQDQDNPQQFLIIEERQNDADLHRHKQTPHFETFKSKAPGLLAAKHSCTILALA